jgi:hypothetical protein
MWPNCIGIHEDVAVTIIPEAYEAQGVPHRPRYE